MTVLVPYEDELARVAGHTFLVPEGSRASGRAAEPAGQGLCRRLRIEYTVRRLADGFARVARVVAGDRLCTWIAIEEWWAHIGIARAADPSPLGVLPPITARAAARPPTAPLAPLVATVEALRASPLSPLHPGRWWIGSDTEWPFHRPSIDLAELTTRPSVALLEHFEWRLMPLRPFTGGRRVGFWQKQIQAGHLPPVVVLAASIFEMFVVLDGHDRLEAAHREGVCCPLRILAPLRTQTWPEDAHTQAMRDGVTHQVGKLDWDAIQPQSQKKLNDAVVRAWARPEHTFVRSRCWPLVGGLEAWQASLPPGAEVLLDVLP